MNFNETKIHKSERNEEMLSPLSLHKRAIEKRTQILIEKIEEIESDLDALKIEEIIKHSRDKGIKSAIRPEFGADADQIEDSGIIQEVLGNQIMEISTRDLVDLSDTIDRLPNDASILPDQVGLSRRTNESDAVYHKTREIQSVLRKQLRIFAEMSKKTDNFRH